MNVPDFLKTLINVPDFRRFPQISQNDKRRRSKRLQNPQKGLKIVKNPLKTLKILRTGPYSVRDARVLACILKSFSGYRASLLYGV